MSTDAKPVRITYRDACRAAIREALQRDERVFLMGEDVGRYGGCFAVSKGLACAAATTVNRTTTGFAIGHARCA